MLSLAVVVVALAMTQWLAAGIAAACLFVSTKFAWGYLIQHRRLQRWAALVFTVLMMFGAVGLGVWAAVVLATPWIWTAAGGAVSLLIAAVAIAWPLGRE